MTLPDLLKEASQLSLKEQLQRATQLTALTATDGRSAIGLEFIRPQPIN